MTNLKLWIAMVVVAIIAITAHLHATPSPQASLGASCQTTTCLENGLWLTSGSLTVGASGSDIGQILEGTCALIVPSGAGATITASTSAPFDCAVTGAQSGDNVIMTIATSTVSGKYGTQLGQFMIVGAKASSTSGFITAMVYNATGGNASPSTYGYASTTTYIITR